MEKKNEGQKACQLLAKFLKHVDVSESSTPVDKQEQERKRMLFDSQVDKQILLISKQCWTGLGRDDIVYKNWENLEITPENRRYVEVIRNWEPGDKGLFLVGNAGIGKTTMLKMLINSVASPSFICKFKSMSDLARDLREMAKDGVNPKNHDIVPSKVNLRPKYHLLVLDDLGSERTTDFVASELFALLESLLKQDIAVFMTSNLSTKELYERYHERTIDRLKELMTTIQMTA